MAFKSSALWFLNIQQLLLLITVYAQWTVLRDQTQTMWLIQQALICRATIGSLRRKFFFFFSFKLKGGSPHVTLAVLDLTVIRLSKVLYNHTWLCKYTLPPPPPPEFEGFINAMFLIKKRMPWTRKIAQWGPTWRGTYSSKLCHLHTSAMAHVPPSSTWINANKFCLFFFWGSISLYLVLSCKSLCKSSCP